MRTDRVVLVTGAAGGMGALVVRRFLENGDTVIATDMSGEALARLPADKRLHTAAGDVADEADCARVAALARDRCGRVDVLVNVAGHFPIQPFEQTTAADFRRVVDVNLTGVFLMIKAVHPLMKGRGWGGSSSSARRPRSRACPTRPPTCRRRPGCGACRGPWRRRSGRRHHRQRCDTRAHPHAPRRAEYAGRHA